MIKRCVVGCFVTVFSISANSSTTDLLCEYDMNGYNADFVIKMDVPKSTAVIELNSSVNASLETTDDIYLAKGSHGSFDLSVQISRKTGKMSFFMSSKSMDNRYVGTCSKYTGNLL